MLILGNKLVKKNIPFVNIELSIPRRTGNFPIPFNSYQQDVSSVQVVPMDQEFDLRVSLLPGDKSIFEMKPKIFLYRYTSRSKKKSAFRGNKKFVHPSDTTINLVGHRYRGGKHNNPYTLLDRITEIPLNINTHSVSGEFERYGGDSSNPDGTIFPFRPLAWMSQCKDIAGNNVQFPQPLYQDISSGLFNGGIGIEAGNVQLQGAGNPVFQYFYSGTNKKYGKYAKRYYFGLQVMVENPDYAGDSQVPQYLAASNMTEFVVDYKTATLIDPTDGVTRKYAIDWRIRNNNPL